MDNNLWAYFFREEKTSHCCLCGLHWCLQGQLFKLMQQLENTTPHFIRCIKPNNKQLPGIYEKDLILEQLRSCGVLEVVRISRSGYPTRMTHQEFTRRLNVLYNYLFILKCSGILQTQSKYFVWFLGMDFCFLRIMQTKILWVLQLLFCNTLISFLKCIKLDTKSCFSEQDKWVYDFEFLLALTKISLSCRSVFEQIHFQWASFYSFYFLRP